MVAPGVWHRLSAQTPCHRVPCKPRHRAERSSHRGVQRAVPDRLCQAALPVSYAEGLSFLCRFTGLPP